MGLFFLTVFVVCTFPTLAVSQETASPAQTPQSHADHQMDTAPHADHQPHTGSGMDAPSHSEHQMHAHHAMRLDASGMVMNENTDELPRGCPRIAGEHHIRVSAGREFARGFTGTMFTYDQREWTVEPCTRLTVSLINTDEVRHQWMLHGLPRYLYDQGMFTLEVAAKGQKTASFIVPPGSKTYLVHCDVPHHMEKGMKAQLKVGGGDGDLPSIPGISGPRLDDPYPFEWGWTGMGVTLIGGLCGLALAGRGLGLL